MSTNLIHILPPQVANQIAAGEVVERPASVVKELVENSLDAGATRIAVRIWQAGKKRIEVEDDGFGMSEGDALLAIRRHATSKIATADDLHHIASHGFRGEALPSIASVSRFRLYTALAGAAEGVEVRVDGGAAAEARPAAARRGTRIEVLDLFLNTPARLNFMRSDKTEEAAIVEVFRNLALANPSTAMSLELDGRSRFDFAAADEAGRVLAVMGEEFAANSIEQTIEHEGIRVEAHLGLATYHHRDSTRMLFMVNGRVIRDKQLLGALRAGYRDVMFHDRYPVAVMRLEMDPADVDVNVHPAKREVRFRSPQTVNSAVIACARAAIARMGQTVSELPTQAALEAMRRTYGTVPAASRSHAGGGFSLPKYSGSGSVSYGRPVPADVQRRLFAAPEMREPAGEYAEAGLDLGRPLAQIHQCYILAETPDGVILVDQHAAHERINYEAMKSQLAKGGLRSQLLLHPADWQVSAHEAAWLHDHADQLKLFGVELDAAGDELFRIRSVPAQLADESPVAVVAELVDACMSHGAGTEGRGRVLERWLGNRACKGSIKSGHTLTHDAQAALLRTMEQTPNIAQCNHGRPTYVRLSLNDLDRLFGRKE